LEHSCWSASVAVFLFYFICISRGLMAGNFCVWNFGVCLWQLSKQLNICTLKKSISYWWMGLQYCILGRYVMYIASREKQAGVTKVWNSRGWQGVALSTMKPDMAPSYPLLYLWCSIHKRRTCL
jgi:hypothetical protein